MGAHVGLENRADRGCGRAVRTGGDLSHFCRRRTANGDCIRDFFRIAARLRGATARCGDRADSLDLVELIMSLEEEFKLQISDEDAEKITTVQEAEDYIEEHLR